MHSIANWQYRYSTRMNSRPFVPQTQKDRMNMSVCLHAYYNQTQTKVTSHRKLFNFIKIKKKDVFVEKIF